MSAITVLVLCFAILGAIDKLLGDVLGVAVFAVMSGIITLSAGMLLSM